MPLFTIETPLSTTANTILIATAFGIPLIAIIIVLYKVFFHAKRKEKKGGYQIHTVGFIRSIRQTGTYINENPQMRIQLDVLNESGGLFQSTLTAVFALSEMHMLTPAHPIPVLYNPSNLSDVILDHHADPEHIQSILDRYNSLKHPNDLTYAQREEIRHAGKPQKALLEHLRLTGKEEQGDLEAEIGIRITNTEKGDFTLQRTMYVTPKSLDYLTIGKYIDVTLLWKPEGESLFTLNLPIDTFSS